MDKQILNFTANEQILVCENPIKISTNKVNYIQAHFDLGTNWSGFDSVRAVWFNDFNCISTVLDSLGNCAVPFEVMKRKGNVKVNLVGSISEDDVLTDRLTSYPVVAVIVDCNAQITGANTQPITPSQFEQYVAIVRSLVDSVKDIDRIELNDDYTLTIYYSDGTSDTTTSIRGADGNGIASVTKTGTSGLVDTYTITFTDGQTTTFTVTNGAKGDTGNGIQSIAKTSTVGLVDTYTITYTDGNTATFTVTNGEKGDKGDTGEVSLQELEDATIAQTLSDSTPYNFRRTNNGNGAGHREYDEIVGASVGWNQLVNTTDTSVTIQSGHKYYSNINNVKTIGLSNGTAISINDGTKDNIIDLTLFNSQIADYVYTLEQSTAGSGVTWLKTHFPRLFDNGYMSFDSGSIKSVEGLSAHEMVGKNLFDGEWESGSINSSGQPAGGGSNIRPKHKIHVLPSKTYAISHASGSRNIYWFTYKADGSFSRYIGLKNTSPSTIVTNASEHYLWCYQYNNTSAPTDMQVEFNAKTDFEPYTKHTYPLDSSVELRGKYKLDANNNLYAVGDVYESDGTVTRNFGVVDLGTLNWSYRNSMFDATLSRGAKIPLASGGAGAVNQKYPIKAPSSLILLEGKCSFVSSGYVNSNTCSVLIKDSTYNGDATAFKNAMSGVYLVYELATPTTETATPYDNPQLCDSNGTEEYVGSELPVGHNTEYPMTLIDTADGLSNGTYEPRITVANGKKTVTWVSV